MDWFIPLFITAGSTIRNPGLRCLDDDPHDKELVELLR